MLKPNSKKLEELDFFLLEMHKRGLTDYYCTEYTPPNERLAKSVMYFQPVMCAPSDRREVATHIIGSTKPEMKSVYNRACNIFITFLYGPSSIYHTLSGKSNPADAFIDFERVAKDPAYVTEIGANIAWARANGFKVWTTTELHTSIQTEARNFCRLKYNDPSRKADSLDLVEWVASWIADGSIDRIVGAKTLADAYNRITDIRGIGPYYAGNPVMMIASLPEASYSHEEAFCAPGGGAVNTLTWLYDGKVNPLKGIVNVWEHQHEWLPMSSSVPTEFHNMDLPYGSLFSTPQKRLTCNSLEVGMCQFSVYRKFETSPELIAKRPNVYEDVSKFKQRELELAGGGINNLLSF